MATSSRLIDPQPAGHEAELVAEVDLLGEPYWLAGCSCGWASTPKRSPLRANQAWHRHCDKVKAGQ